MPWPSVYVIMFRDTGRYYIGASREWHKRWEKHLRRLVLGNHENKRLQAEFDRRDGADITFYCVENLPNGASDVDLARLEEETIRRYVLRHGRENVLNTYLSVPDNQFASHSPVDPLEAARAARAS